MGNTISNQEARVGIYVGVILSGASALLAIIFFIVQNWLRTRDRIAAQTLRAARDVEMANLLKVIDNLQAAVITTREEQKAMAVSYRERETITSAKSPFASPRGLAAQASS